MLGPIVSVLQSALQEIHSTSDVFKVLAWGFLVWAIATLLIDLVKISRDPARHVPGPLIARFTRLWYLRQFATARIHHINHELHQKYGPIVRVAPGQYSVSTSDAARVVFAYGGKFAKSDWYSPFGRADMKGIFTLQDIRQHAELRRKLANVYSLTALRDYEPYVDECISLLHERFKEFAASGQTFDLHHYLKCFAFDLITLLTWSTRLGFLDKGEDVNDFMDGLSADQWMGTLLGLFPEWVPRVRPWLIKFNLPGGRGPNSLLKFTFDFLQEKKEHRTDPEPGKPMDFVQKLLFEREVKGKSSLSDKDILLAATANMGAGTDTIGATLTAVCYYLTQNPKALARLRQELSDAEHEGRLSEIVTYEQASHLPYLQAVIKEAVRMHPAASLPLPRVVPEGGAVVAGTFLPAGSVVGVNPYVMHYNTDIYGDDAAMFRPERWLTGEGEPSLRESDFYGFGSGARNCLGKNIAMLEMVKLVPTLIRDFDITSAAENKEQEWTVETFLISKPEQYQVTIKERK